MKGMNVETLRICDNEKWKLTAVNLSRLIRVLLEQDFMRLAEYVVQILLFGESTCSLRLREEYTASLLSSLAHRALRYPYPKEVGLCCLCFEEER
jgi:hypothetical protein